MRQLARQKTAKIATQREKSLRLRNFASFVKSVSRLASVVMRQLARQKTAKTATQREKCLRLRKILHVSSKKTVKNVKFPNLVCPKGKIAKNVKFVNLATLKRKIVKFGTEAKNRKIRRRVQSWT